MTSPAMTRIGPSESQSRALAKRDRPYVEGYWTSQDARTKRRREPPHGVDAKVAWLRREWEMEMPSALHEAGVWHDHVTQSERAQGIQPVGGSDLGARAYSGPFRRRLEGEGIQRDDDGSSIQPLVEALKALRKTRRWGHDAIARLIYYAHFDWRSMADVPFYDKQPDGSRILVRVLDLDVLDLVLDKALEALWYLFTEREAIAQEPP